MSGEGYWYIVGLVHGICMAILIFNHRFKKYRENWSCGWKIGELVTIDTIDSGDVDLLKYHGEKLPIAGFSPDRRACFVVPLRVKAEETDEATTFTVSTYTLVVPFDKLHRVKQPDTPVP